MLKRLTSVLMLVCGAVALTPTDASAQQTVNFSLGVFVPRGEDARDPHDVLVANRDFLFYDFGEFTSASVGGEWLVALGKWFEAGAGISFSRSTADSFYIGYMDDATGGNVEQELKLRLIPIAFTVRALPLGQTSSIQPYIGGGLAVINWRYSESGEFVDFSRGNAIFRDQFVASGNETGPVVLGGVRFAGDSLSAGAEVRYYSAEGEIGTSSFASPGAVPKIDLGGWTYQFNIGLRFGP